MDQRIGILNSGKMYVNYPAYTEGTEEELNAYLKYADPYVTYGDLENLARNVGFKVDSGSEYSLNKTASVVLSHVAFPKFQIEVRVRRHTAQVNIDGWIFDKMVGEFNKKFNEPVEEDRAIEKHVMLEEIEKFLEAVVDFVKPSSLKDLGLVKGNVVKMIRDAYEGRWIEGELDDLEALLNRRGDRYTIAELETLVTEMWTSHDECMRNEECEMIDHPGARASAMKRLVKKEQKIEKLLQKLEGFCDAKVD